MELWVHPGVADPWPSGERRDRGADRPDDAQEPCDVLRDAERRRFVVLGGRGRGRGGRRVRVDVARPASVADLKELVGRELGPTDWVDVDQAKIDAFAEVTGDHQWIHVDPERAAESPMGSTIAHGLLT